MKRAARTGRGQAGQAIVESVLIITLLFGFTMVISSYFKKQEVFKQLISGPWVVLAGMLQNGVWMPADTGAAYHPAANYRHIVPQPESAK